MSICKRTWKTAKGDTKEAWVVDYVDQTGKRWLTTDNPKCQSRSVWSLLQLAPCRSSAVGRKAQLSERSFARPALFPWKELRACSRHLGSPDRCCDAVLTGAA